MTRQRVSLASLACARAKREPRLPILRDETGTGLPYPRPFSGNHVIHLANFRSRQDSIHDIVRSLQTISKWLTNYQMQNRIPLLDMSTLRPHMHNLTSSDSFGSQAVERLLPQL